LPAYLSGAPASEVLRQFTPGMTMDASDQHAESAILAVAGSLVLGVVALAGLIHFRKGRRLPRIFLGFVLSLALLACGLLAWTANLGGKIRHLELGRQSSTSPDPLKPLP
jgi:hypothetical protein